MSPILKRDVAEHYRQARRFAAAFTGDDTLDPPPRRDYDPASVSGEGSGSGTKTDGSYASASGARRGGIGDEDPPPDPRGHAWRQTVPAPGRPAPARDESATPTPASIPVQQAAFGVGAASGSRSRPSLEGLPRKHRQSTGGSAAYGHGKGKARSSDAGDADEEPFLPLYQARGGTEDQDEREWADRPADTYGVKAGLLGDPRRSERGRGLRIPNGGQMSVDDGVPSREVRNPDKWTDLRCLLFEATPSLLVSLVGLVFTGELLEHLARWRVFRRVDELFILVPMLGNLKGNLEMCLSARLGTSAAIGELDHRATRRALILANLTLLGLQALLISCLAAVISFVLGLLTIHRLGDAPPTGLDLGPSASNATAAALSAAAAAALGLGSGSGVVDPGLAVGEVEWHEGYTRPGWKQLVMVLATGMGAAGISSAVLGSFMGSMVIACRWSGIDPDNITSPVAACLGDLLTLFILALLGTGLVGTMDTPVPLVAVILMSVAAAWFTRRVMRNQWVKNVAKGGWVPLIGAMLISSGTGMVLDKGVGKYRGFALLAISMTGLTGSIGGIHANRLSTRLHTNLHPASLDPQPAFGLSPFLASMTLYALAFPCQLAFLLFVNWAGWIDLDLGWAGWLAFASTTAISLLIAHHLTLFFWSKNLDPDSYTLPIQSALVDFLGQLLLMMAYELCIWQGVDVQVTDIL